MTDEHKLRMLQIACIAYVLISFFVLSRFAGPPTRTITAGQWMVTLIGFHCSIFSFPMRDRVIRGPKNRRTAPRISSEKRWIAGNIFHLAYSTSVCIWVFVLQVLGAPTWIVRFLLAIGILSLVVFTPSKRGEAN